MRSLNWFFWTWSLSFDAFHLLPMRVLHSVLFIFLFALNYFCFPFFQALFQISVYNIKFLMEFFKELWTTFLIMSRRLILYLSWEICLHEIFFKSYFVLIWRAFHILSKITEILYKKWNLLKISFLFEDKGIFKK